MKSSRGSVFKSKSFGLGSISSHIVQRKRAKQFLLASLLLFDLLQLGIPYLLCKKVWSYFDLDISLTVEINCGESLTGTTEHAILKERASHCGLFHLHYLNIERTGGKQHSNKKDVTNKVHTFTFHKKIASVRTVSTLQIWTTWYTQLCPNCNIYTYISKETVVSSKRSKMCMVVTQLWRFSRAEKRLVMSRYSEIDAITYSS